MLMRKHHRFSVTPDPTGAGDNAVRGRPDRRSILGLDINPFVRSPPGIRSITKPGSYSTMDRPGGRGVRQPFLNSFYPRLKFVEALPSFRKLDRRPAKLKGYLVFRFRR